MNCGSNPRRGPTSATERPVTMATGRRRVRRARRSETARVTRASSGRSTMAARVPSKSKASNESDRSAVSSARRPSGSSRRLMSGVVVALHASLDAPAQAQAPGVGQHAPGPAIDVEFAHRHPQAGHAFALLRLRHRQGALDLRGAVLDMVRIDDQGLRHLAGSPGEAAQYQHAALIVARGDEFLAYEVHAVMQTGDQAHVGGAIELVDGVALVVLHQQADRSVLGRPEALVDVFGQQTDALLKQAVLLEHAARRRGRLHQHEPADPLRPLLEQPLHRLHPLDHALGVIETVDSDRNLLVGGKPQPLRHVAPALLDRRPGRHAGRAWPFDRDRIAFDEGVLVLVRNRRVLVLDARFQSAIDGLDEILAVKTRLEAHDGAAEHALQNFAPPGADPKGLGVRPRNVPEGEDRRPRKPLPDHRRKQRSVYSARAGGASIWSRGSTPCRSALPLPWAIHVPEHARSTGSIAVTSPLAGRLTIMPAGACSWM